MRAGQPSAALSCPGGGQLLSLRTGPEPGCPGQGAELPGLGAEDHRDRGVTAEAGPGDAVSPELGSPEASGLDFQKGRALVGHLLRAAELCSGTVAVPPPLLPG